MTLLGRWLANPRSPGLRRMAIRLDHVVVDIIAQCRASVAPG